MNSYARLVRLWLAFGIAFLAETKELALGQAEKPEPTYAKREPVPKGHVRAAEVLGEQVTAEHRASEYSPKSGSQVGTKPPSAAVAIRLGNEIATADGKVYREVKVLRVEPDGITVTFQPKGGGVGMAKLKFENLPENLQQQYGYDAQKASSYEAQYERGLKNVQAKIWADFKAECSAAAKYRQENYRELARREEERKKKEEEEEEQRRLAQEAAKVL